MKKLLLFAMLFVSIVAKSEVVYEEILPENCKFTNNSGVITATVHGKDIVIDNNLYAKYKNNKVKLLFGVKRNTDGTNSYYIRPLTNADKDKDLKELGVLFEELMDVIYDIAPNLVLDIILETNEYENIKLILDRY